MRVVDIVIASLMAPLGLALGLAAVHLLAPLPVSPLLSGFVLVIAVVAADMLLELRGDAIWSAVPEWCHLRSRRARRMARNLFLGGFIAAVMMLVLLS